MTHPQIRAALDTLTDSELRDIIDGCTHRLFALARDRERALSLYRSEAARLGATGADDSDIAQAMHNVRPQ